MNSIKTFEDLQNLGVDALYDHTHIARHQIELILNKSFDSFSRMQFMGFISILEREYKIDLSSLREEYEAQNPIVPSFTSAASLDVLQAPSTSRSKWIAGGIGAILLLLIITSMTQGELSSAPKEEVMKLKTAPIEVVDYNATAENNITTVEANTTESNLSEINKSNTANVIITPEENLSITSEQQGIDFGPALSIKPTSKVWVGMMDLDSGKKTQRKTSEPIVIDTTKKWLFIFGHGRLKIITSDGDRILKERNAVWFAYENGSLKQLNREQFEEKNHGSRW